MARALGDVRRVVAPGAGVNLSSLGYWPLRRCRVICGLKLMCFLFRLSSVDAETAVLYP